MKIRPKCEVGFDAIVECIYRFHEARTGCLVPGTYDLAVLFTGKTMWEVSGFVSQELAVLDSVLKSETAVPILG